MEKREIYWIKKYNTFNHGYNATPGGNIINIQNGENHPKAKLKEIDVLNIRKLRFLGARRMEVFDLYKDRIGASGFNKIWNNSTWKTIGQDFFLNESERVSCSSSMAGERNGRAKYTEKQVVEIKTRQKAGEDLDQVFKDFCSISTRRIFRNIWEGKSWKHIKV